MSNTMTLKQRAYRDIRSRIEAGLLHVGARLSEVSLSKDLAISRTPIREAIQQLASEGIVEQIPHYGAFVKELSAEELEGLFSLRETLECYAVERAIDRLTETDFDLLERLCHAMRRMVRMAYESKDGVIDGELAHEWITNDSLFHMVLIRAARNTWLKKMVGDLKLMTRMFGQRREPLEASNLVRVYAGHRRIVRAMRRHDVARARAEMAKHIQRGCKLVMALRGMQPTPHFDTSRVDASVWPVEVRDYIRRLELFDQDETQSG